MKNTEAVHQLIRTLSKAEKRHFKMTAARYSKNQNNYILLFDAIEQQEVYDEAKLKKKFRTQSFGQNIGKTKYLLYELLLKSLRPLYSSKNVVSQLQGMLQSVDFLFSKCLYEQAAVLLRKAKKQAIHYQLYPYYFEVLSFEKKLIGYQSQKMTAKKIADFLQEYDKIAGVVRTEMRYQVSSEKLHFLSMTVDYEEWIAIQEEEIRLFPVEDFNGKPTFLSALFRREILSMNAFSKGNVRLALEYQNEIHQQWSAHTDLIPVFADHFARTNQKYIEYLLHQTGREEELQYVLQFLKEKQSALTLEEGNKIHLQQLILDFIINLTLENLEICTLLICRIEEQLDVVKAVISQQMQMQFYYHVGIFYFLRNDFDESLDWMLKTKELANHNLYPRSQRFCQLIELIARYELGEYVYLESAIRNMYRSLKQEPQKNEIETLVLQSVRKLIKVSHKSEVTNILTDLYDSLVKADYTRQSKDHLQTNLLFDWINKYLSTESHEQFN